MAVAILVLIGGVAWYVAKPDAIRPAGKEASLSTMSQGPSIAVLPFNNLSSDPKDDYFADGLTEDIITELSRFRELRVHARNTTF